MKPTANFQTSKELSADDDADIQAANAVRSNARKQLVRRFWRHLGAA